MRRHWNHHAASNVQPVPEDNTSEYVHAQVAVWADTGVLIHPEMALEIAAWRQEGDNAFAQFASTGTITEGLLDEIRAEIREDKRNWEGRDRWLRNWRDSRRNLVALHALCAYVEAAEPN